MLPKSRDVREIFLGYFLILVAVWTPDPARSALFLLSVVVLVGFCVRDRLEGVELGFGLRGFGTSIWAVAVALTVAAVAVELASHYHTLNFFYGRTLLGKNAIAYLVWSLLAGSCLCRLCSPSVVRGDDAAPADRADRPY